MSSPSARQTQEALEILLAVARLGGPSAPAPVEAVDYDWKQPYRFGRDQRQRLHALGQAAAARMAKQLSTLFRTEIAASATDLVELYATGLRASASADGFFAVPLTDPGRKPCGLVQVGPGIAFGWVDKLLGGDSPPPAGGAARALALIEATLLVDIVGVMAAGFSAASQESGGPVLKCGDTVATDAAGIPGGTHDVFCTFHFEAALGETRSPFAFTLLADVLAPVADPAGLKKKARGPDEIRKDVIGHLEQVTVAARARLGEAVISLRDAMALEPGDVLVLNRKIHEPIELLVQDRVAAHGFPVQNEGRYAFQVGERRADPRARL